MNGDALDELSHTSRRGSQWQFQSPPRGLQNCIAHRASEKVVIKRKRIELEPCTLDEGSG